MPGEPTIDQLIPNVEASGFGVQALMLNKNLVANRIAPVVKVNKVEGSHYVLIPREALSAEVQTKIGHDGRSSEVNHVLKKSTYNCEEFGKHSFLSDRDRANADLDIVDYLKGDEILLNELAVEREIALRDLLLEEDNYYSTDHWFAATAAWDLSTTDPAVDIDLAVRRCLLSSGYMPNTLLLPPRSHDILKRNTEVKDLIRYNPMAGGYLATGQIPGGQIFNLRIVVAGGIMDDAALLEAENLGFIWEDASTDAGDDWAWIGYVDPRPSKRSGGFAFQFAFNQMEISDQDIVRKYEYYVPERRGWIDEFITDYDQKITNKRSAVVITGLRSATSS